MEVLKNITDTMKFIIMLLIYVGYMTWWAASISNTVADTVKHLDEHVVADNIVTNAQIVMQEQLHFTTEHVGKNAENLANSAEAHATCAEIMKGLLRRMEKVEQNDQELQDKFYNKPKQQFRY